MSDSNGNPVMQSGVTVAYLDGKTPMAYENVSIFDVTMPDYGATGDGVTDDAAAIQAALDAAGAAGGTVLIPAGTYIINTKLDVDAGDNVRIVGVGRPIIQAGASIAGLIDANGVNDLAIEGIRLNGASNISSNGRNLEITGCTNVVVREVESYDLSTGTTAGIYVNGSNRVKLLNNIIRDIGRAIYFTGGDCNDFEIAGNEIYNHGRLGISIEGSASVNHSRGHIHHNYLHDHEDQGSGRLQIVVGGNDANLNQDIAISNNVVVGNGVHFNDGTTPGSADQIIVQRTDGFVIEGNASRDGGDRGITVSQQAKNGIVRGNIVTGNDTAGISVGSAASTTTDQIVVTGNIFWNNGKDSGAVPVVDAGVYINNASNVLVEGNNFNDSATTQDHGIEIIDSSNVRIGINTYSGLGVDSINDVSGNTNVEVASLTSMGMFTTANPAAGQTLYATPPIQSTVEAGIAMRAPFTGIARNLHVVVPGAVGTGESLATTFRVEGSDTSLTATISGASAVEAADTTNTPAFTKGDLIVIKHVASNAGSYTQRRVNTSVELVQLAD